MMMRLFFTAVLAALSTSSIAQQLAFPTAEGYGRFAMGGRGGSVCQVTSLADSGPGTLRDCITRIGPRTVVFRVAGTIQLNSELAITNPYITIAGQTAPGQGITLRSNVSQAKNPPIRVLAGHVIIRHIRLRPGGPEHRVSDNIDSTRIGGVGSIATTENITDIIFDHVTFSWSTDELIDSSPWADRITIQDSLIYEGLNTQGHSKGPNLRGCGVSIVRSLIANNVIRNPNNTCGFADGNTIRGGGGVTGENEFRNNVVFNGVRGYFDYWNGRGDSEVNIAGNVFIRGPNTLNGKAAPYPVDARDFTSKYADHGLTPGQGFVNAGTSDRQALCLQDNLSIGLPGNNVRPAPVYGVLDPRDAHLVKSTDCVNEPVGNPEASGGTRGLTGPLMPSGEVEAYVLDHAGAFTWKRDSTDARLVAQVRNRQGAIITTVAHGGGYATLAAGAPYPDADVDGMADAWEVAKGVTDGNADADGDGYTNLEEYLNNLIAE